MAGYTPNDQGIYTIPLLTLNDCRQLWFNYCGAPGFDAVDSVHSENSYHYVPGGGVVDIQDWRPDFIDGVNWQTRTGNLRDKFQGRL